MGFMANIPIKYTFQGTRSLIFTEIGVEQKRSVVFIL